MSPISPAPPRSHASPAAVVITGDITLLPVLCVVILPAWLLVSRAPAMIVEHPVVERWL